MGNGARPTAATTKAGQRELRAPQRFTPGAPQNFIKESAVRSWTRGNAEGVPAVGYHLGNDDHLDRVEHLGIDVSKANGYQGGGFGRGFYMWPAQLNPWNQDGSQRSVRVAIRMQNPLIVHPEHLSQWFDRAAAAHADVVRRVAGGHVDGMYRDAFGREGKGSDNLRTHLALAEGHDGIIVRMSDAEKLRYGAVPGTADWNDDQIIAIKPGSVRVIQ